jgi:hypothetical protein
MNNDFAAIKEMVWQYCDRGLESQMRNIKYPLLGIDSAPLHVADPARVVTG